MPQGILNDIVGDGEPRLESELEARLGLRAGCTDDPEPRSGRQGLPSGVKRTRSAKNPAFRALSRRNFKPGHCPGLGAPSGPARPGAIKSRHDGVRCDDRHSLRAGTRATVVLARVTVVVRPGKKPGRRHPDFGKENVVRHVPIPTGTQGAATADHSRTILWSGSTGPSAALTLSALRPFLS